MIEPNPRIVFSKSRQLGQTVGISRAVLEDFRRAVPILRTPEWFAVLPWAGLALISLMSLSAHYRWPRILVGILGYFAGLAWGLGGWHLLERLGSRASNREA